jgi:hypothetical protein
MGAPPPPPSTKTTRANTSVQEPLLDLAAKSDDDTTPTLNHHIKYRQCTKKKRGEVSKDTRWLYLSPYCTDSYAFNAMGG